MGGNTVPPDWHVDFAEAPDNNLWLLIMKVLQLTNLWGDAMLLAENPRELTDLLNVPLSTRFNPDS